MTVHWSAVLKTFFIRVYRCLYEASKLYGSSAFSAEETPEALDDIIWKLSFLTDIEKEITDRLHIFFSSTDDRYAQYPLAYQLRLYIDENFEKEDLLFRKLLNISPSVKSYLMRPV